ncbi:MAG: 2-oxo acid dehydrogenase subunit E2 [Gammaproteobacteria bacterium]|nr:2-oxo acid dehydrogenase subunit E2 [Gammaproteobacteria bacterium]
MPREIYLVKVGMTMTEGMVSEWFIADGAAVKKGEMLYSLETEKVNLDVDAEMDGIVKHTAEAGVMLAPGDVVGYIFAADEEVPADFSGVASPAVAVVDAPKSEVPAAAVSAAPEPIVAETIDGRLKSSPAARRLAGELGVTLVGLVGSGPGGRIVEADVSEASLQPSGTAMTQAISGQTQEALVKASPLARRLAAERGIDLSRIQGSGPQGRIVQGDLDQAPSSRLSATPAQVGPLAGSSVPVRGMRKTIAQRMHQSLQTSAQLSMDMTAQMDDAVRLRGQLLKEWDGEARPSYTDLVIKAVAKALGQHPMMNSRFDDTEITLLREIHMGLAVSVPEGLLVPVIRNVHELDLKEIAQESARLATAARNGTLGLDDYAGGTFTISALGMFGVNSFTPIINQPQTGILGVNQLFDGLTWDGDKPIKTKQMNLSLTWDHRAVDGAPAAEFLASVVEFLSEPYRLLL